MLLIRKFAVACALVAALLVAGCGSSTSSPSATAPASGATTAPASGATTSTRTSSQAASGTAGQANGALSADATSAATGDIPDNQVFLVFRNPAARYSIKYPEGWTRTGSDRDITFRDKNNLVHVVIAAGPAPTPASVAAQLNALKGSDPTLTFKPPAAVTIGSSPAVKTVYTTESAPNPVTGKRVLLIVDRYELARAGRVATVDLGTPKGVDNVDAYRMMIESFRWL